MGASVNERSKARVKRAVAGVLVAGCLVSTIAPASGYIRPRKIRLVTTGLDGKGGNQSTHNSAAPGLTVTSANGRYVAFSSDASNLVPGDINLSEDIFRYDTQTRKITMVTRGYRGEPSLGGCPNDPTQDPLAIKNTASFHPSISADGRFISFQSCAANLVEDDKNILGPDVFVRDMKKGKTYRVSADVKLTLPQIYTHAGGPQGISDDGRFVTFAAADLATPWQIFVHDRRKKKTRLITATKSGARSNGTAFVLDNYQDSGSPSISGNGRFVAFTSTATNLGGPDEEETLPVKLPAIGRDTHVFVYDMDKKKFEMIDVAKNGDPGKGFRADVFGAVTGTMVSFGPRISRDGRHVAFTSFASNLVPNDTVRLSNVDTATRNIFVRDRKKNETTRVDVTSAGAHAASNADGRPVNFLSSSFPRLTSISADGRHTAFSAWIPLEDASDSGLVYVHDSATGSTTALRNMKGDFIIQADGYISPDARTLAFVGPDKTVPEDENSFFDVFYMRRGTPLGVGELSSVGDSLRSASIPQAAGRRDALGDVDVASRAGADLSGATVVHRPDTDDLYVKIDVEELGGIAGTGVVGNPDIVYSLGFRADGVRYEARSVSLGTAALFGLFRCTGADCRRVADLRGGFGTTGDSVVFSVPLDAIDAEGVDELSALEATSSLGGYASGGLKTLDRINITR